MYYASLQTSPT